jgi:hypothetical protein
VIEKTGKGIVVPATTRAPHPGDFAIGSMRSRAAARALLEKRQERTRPPDFTIDLTSETEERCQAIYALLADQQHTMRDDVPYGAVKFPAGFKPRTLPSGNSKSYRVADGGSQPIRCYVKLLRRTADNPFA